MLNDLLQSTINLGLQEKEYWEMTPAEIERYTIGVKYRYQQQASYDYILANLIGVSVSRLFSKDAEMPTIEQVYSNLFENDKQYEEQKQTQQSITNFMNAAMAINQAAAARKNKEVNS